MDQQHLLDFIARSPGTIERRMGRQIAVGMIAGGRVEAAGALVDLMGLSVLPALAAAGVPASALRRAIETALLKTATGSCRPSSPPTAAGPRSRPGAGRLRSRCRPGYRRR